MALKYRNVKDAFGESAPFIVFTIHGPYRCVASRSETYRERVGLRDRHQYDGTR